MEQHELDARRSRYQEVIDAFCLLDDAFMTAVFQDSLDCVNLVIQIILDMPELHAEKVVTQDTLKNLQGHGVRLDIHAFADGQEFNIEIQRAEKAASQRHARYNSSIMDANALAEGTDYAQLPESYVIFITETDVLGYGRPIYRIRRIIEEENAHFDDGTHIIYVNSSVTDVETPLGKLMHDFRCKRPEEMFYDVLARRTSLFKNYGRGEAEMTDAEKIIKEIKEEARTEGVQQGMQQGMQQGIQQGMQQGKDSERVFSIKSVMKNLELTAERAMDVLSIPKTERGKYKALL